MARPHLCVSQASTADSGSLANLWIQSALQQGISQDASCRLANAATVAIYDLWRRTGYVGGV